MKLTGCVIDTLFYMKRFALLVRLCIGQRELRNTMQTYTYVYSAAHIVLTRTHILLRQPAKYMHVL